MDSLHLGLMLFFVIPFLIFLITPEQIILQEIELLIFTDKWVQVRTNIACPLGRVTREGHESERPLGTLCASPHAGHNSGPGGG